MDDAERGKVAELVREIRDPNDAKTPREENKLNWMYKGPTEVVDREDYLLGKVIDKSFDENSTGEVLGRAYEQSNVPKRLLSNTEGVVGQVDIAKKMHEDPLYAIRKKEMEARKKLLSNPVKLKQLQEMLMKKNKIAKSGKKKKKIVSVDDALLKRFKKMNKSDILDIIQGLSSSSGDEHQNEKPKIESASSHYKNRGLTKKVKSVSSSDESESRGRSKKHPRETQKSSKQKNRDETRKEAHKYRNEKNKSKISDRTEKSSKKHIEEKEKHRKREGSSEDGRREKQVLKTYLQKKKKKRESESSCDDRRGKKQASRKSKKKRKKQSSSSSDSESTEEDARRVEKRKLSRREKETESSDDRSSRKKSSHQRSEKQRRQSRGHSTSEDDTSSSESERKRRRKTKRKRSKSESSSHNKGKEQKTIEDSSGSSEGSSSSDDDNSAVKRSKGYGLMAADGSKLVSAKTSDLTVSKYKPKEEKSRYVKEAPKKITEQEREKLLQEMQVNAKERKKERESGIKRFRKEKVRSEKTEDYDEDFLRKQLLYASTQGSMADRVKSNINKIQRSESTMNNHFVRR